MIGPQVDAWNVGAVRGGRTILDDVSLTARPGQMLAITGPSGSGKTSLLAILGGLDSADEGGVTIDGVPVSGLRRGTGLVLQAYGLVSVLTAAENVEVALHAQDVPPDEVRHRTDAFLAAVGLSPVADHLVEELSGGQQQRVAVARALVIEPDLLLADEPTAQLDAVTKEEILDLIVSLARRGSTVVIATHDTDVTDKCDDVVSLRDGRLNGRPRHVRSS